jgi:hypothetical protein
VAVQAAPLFFEEGKAGEQPNIVNHKGHKDHKVSLALKLSSLWFLCSSWLDLVILWSGTGTFTFEEMADNGIILC